MKKVRVQDAAGLPLCHDITAIRDGSKGPAFKRGHIIRQEDIEELLSIGKKHVFISDIPESEVHEDDAAMRLAAAMRTDGAHFSGPSEGKVVLKADADGLFVFDRDLLDALNSIGDITITTLPNRYPVKAGARLASMRIVPLTTSEAQIAEAERLCAEAKLFTLKEYRHLKAAVIITGSEFTSGRAVDKFGGIAREKLAAYPCGLIGTVLTGDEPADTAAAIEGFIRRGASLVLVSGGMSVDPDDRTPEAIRMTGAEVVSHGVPSQPGNMTMLAYSSGEHGIGDAVIIGVPGAAVSCPTTMLDVLLPRIFAGERITKGELLGLADGGLCQNCDVCRFPNCTFGRWR